MKCSKCNYEIPNDSKFCNHCGKEIEMSTLEIADKLVENTKRIYFIVGMIHGMVKSKPKDKKIKKVYQELLKLGSYELEIKEIIEFWLKGINEKTKKD